MVNCGVIRIELILFPGVWDSWEDIVIEHLPTDCFYRFYAQSGDHNWREQRRCQSFASLLEGYLDSALLRTLEV
uniref:Uncharacterized protein n=1 Tax=Ditylenchus dipsaci TaxID=166011 RepID=A0A915E054_9BILA